MFHLTMFGGTGGEISPSGFTAVTVFGGAELRRPTLARRLLHMKNERQAVRSQWARMLGTDRNLILTAFGATVIKKATLMEEYQALKSLVQTGAVRPDEARQMLDAVILRGDDHEMYTTFTIFGGTTVEEPDAHKERKAIDAAAKSGLISDSEHAALHNAIGSSEPAVARVLGDLVAAPA